MVETTCVMADKGRLALEMARRAARTESETPWVRKVVFSSVMVGGLGWLTRGCEVVPMEERVSMPVYWLMVRTFSRLEIGDVCQRLMLKLGVVDGLGREGGNWVGRGLGIGPSRSLDGTYAGVEG